MISKATSIDRKPSSKSDYIFFIKDYFSLVKPKVMTLVIFTALVGIIIAPGTIHPWLAFVSIFCIFSFSMGIIGISLKRDFLQRDFPYFQQKFLRENYSF